MEMPKIHYNFETHLVDHDVEDKITYKTIKKKKILNDEMQKS